MNPLRTGAVSHASGTAEPDRHLAVLDDDRDGAAAFAELEHPLQRVSVFLDVDVSERDLPPCIVVTGGLRVGSGVLAEDLDHSSIVWPAPRGSIPYSGGPCPPDPAPSGVAAEALEIVSPALDDRPRLTVFVSHDAYQHARAAYEQSRAAYPYARVAYFHREVTEIVGAVLDEGSEDPDCACRDQEIVAHVQEVLRQASDDRANGADEVPGDANVVSDGQELSADCINLLREDADEHSHCINPSREEGFFRPSPADASARPSPRPESGRISRSDSRNRP